MDSLRKIYNKELKIYKKYLKEEKINYYAD